jgi:hypothetical protein
MMTEFTEKLSCFEAEVQKVGTKVVFCISPPVLAAKVFHAD